MVSKPVSKKYIWLFLFFFFFLKKNFYTWLWKVLLPPESGESLNWNIYSLRELVRNAWTRSCSFCSEWFPYHHKLTLLFSSCWKIDVLFPPSLINTGKENRNAVSGTVPASVCAQIRYQGYSDFVLLDTITIHIFFPSRHTSHFNFQCMAIKN